MIFCRPYKVRDSSPSLQEKHLSFLFAGKWLNIWVSPAWSFCFEIELRSCCTEEWVAKEWTVTFQDLTRGMNFKSCQNSAWWIRMFDVHHFELHFRFPSGSGFLEKKVLLYSYIFLLELYIYIYIYHIYICIYIYTVANLYWFINSINSFVNV